MEVKGEEIVRSILEEVISKVYRHCSTEYSVAKKQKNMSTALLGASDEKIIAKRDIYQEQTIEAKKIFRRVARETVRDLIILATRQAATSSNNGQLTKTAQFRFAYDEAQKNAHRVHRKRVKIQKNLQVKVTIGSEIVQYTLRCPANRAIVAEGNMAAIQKSNEAQREITAKAKSLYTAVEKTANDPMIQASRDCNIPGPAVVDLNEPAPVQYNDSLTTSSAPDANNEIEDDPEPKGWRRLLCCGKPLKKQAKEKKLGLLNRLRGFFVRR
ncbi:uncharacterized protein LOC134228830 isoform X1 [Saccostrea cucullata]|uniref:uncharacterized protein LOC134228830 isoform X1 n=1 Tax=Saccostrea cuccullata TaxID=36930 RepID=UPI002ED20667